ncbi:DUF2971 domain-containing protein [Acidobacteria bacterium AH-259-G07]|nr:DUF2971 domain-containing protein [Acidobacteria bacterium AH-259-G07]
MFRRKLSDGLLGGVVAPLELEPFWDVFVFSLSEKPNLLSQWGAYGASGAGYSVGFDTTQVEGNFLKVEYERQSQEEIVRPMFRKTLDFVKKLSGKYAKREVGACCLAALSQSLLPAAIRIKHKGFSEEAEWRLIHIRQAPHPQLGSPTLETRLERVQELEFRTSKSGALIPFVTSNLRQVNSPEKKLPITVIWQGPHISPKLGKQSLRLLCDRFDYVDVRLESSNIPLAQF